MYAFRIQTEFCKLRARNVMKCKCSECDGEITIPKDAVNGEIVTCPDCGLEFELTFDENGKCSLKVAELTGEDWGE